jgi:eukaryotic-like serine/threonine-protein kinase
MQRVGRYVLFEEFARGGMASVHFARLVGAEGFSRVVAVKRVRTLFNDSDDHRRALLREAKIASRIRHPNVVQTLDIVLDGGVAHVVMEYVHGVTVAELLAEAKVRGERAPVAVAVGILADALQGLHAAHEAQDKSGKLLGIVHRDVSPQNVHVGVDGHARLLDFGIAKALDRTQVTEPGVVKGKIAYMAREQLGGAPVTRQADVYAAGVVLWELLTGRRLFDEGEPALLAARVLSETIPAPSSHAPEVPPALDQVVLRATAPDPRQRYETAAEMQAALTPAALRADPGEIGAWVERLAGDQLELRAETVKRVESAEIGEDVPASPEPSARPRRRLLAVSLVAGCAAIVVGGAFAAARPRPDETPRMTEVPPSTPTPTSTSTSTPPPTSTSTSTPAPTLLASPLSSASPLRAKPSKHRSAPSCDPPFSIDSNGTKIYKPECLR